MPPPSITVIMPTFNCAEYLPDAILSIQRQTFKDFKLLIINDGSTDNTKFIIEKFMESDQRIELIENTVNIGLPASLNLGLSKSYTKYIARMDADDIAHPKRLEEQIDFMENTPGVVALSTSMQLFGDKDLKVLFPTDPEIISIQLIFQNSLCHPSALIRNEHLAKHRIFYSLEHPHAEDFELWTRLAQTGKLCNLKKILHFYRWHSNQVSQSNKETQYQSGRRIIHAYVESTLHVDLSDEELEILQLDSNRERKKIQLIESQKLTLDSTLNTLRKLINANAKINHFNHEKLTKFFEKKYQNTCLIYGRTGWNFYFKNSLTKNSFLTQRIILLARLTSLFVLKKLS